LSSKTIEKNVLKREDESAKVIFDNDGKKRVAKMKSENYIDEEGYCVTRQVKVFVTDDEEDVSTNNSNSKVSENSPQKPEPVSSKSKKKSINDKKIFRGWRR